MAAKRKHIFVTDMKQEWACSLYTELHFFWHENLNIFEKGLGMRLKLSSAPLIQMYLFFLNIINDLITVQLNKYQLKDMKPA